LIINEGNNYTFSGSTITPSPDFVGTLIVRIKVNDGKSDSNLFDFVITVEENDAVNIKPVITAQSAVTIFKDEPVTLQLSYLSVTDPDNSYPDDFTLQVLTAENYVVDQTTVTPLAGFLGTITVKLTVSDGTDESNIFDFRVDVVEKEMLQIIGQAPIIIKEDSSFVFTADHLKVHDPANEYPLGFTLNILAGDNYSIDGSLLAPQENFHGDLFVDVYVSKGTFVSNTYKALIIVQPVNDPPGFVSFSTDPLYAEQPSDILISREAAVGDIDNDKLAYAEISLDSMEDEVGVLGFTPSGDIHGIYDSQAGTLILLGAALLEEYDKVLKTISLSVTDSSIRSQRVRFRLNDGQTFGGYYDKTVLFPERNLSVDIPKAFTPNNDHVNDTWQIFLNDATTEISDVLLQVYDHRGSLVYKSNELEGGWDGTLNGELLPSDSYFYTLQINASDGSLSYTGIVTILR
jgi:gliding motility-associated-like protein